MSLNSLSLPFFAQSSHLIQFLQAPISLPPSLLGSGGVTKTETMFPRRSILPRIREALKANSN